MEKNLQAYTEMLMQICTAVSYTHLADNTDDKNLKKACQVCMADSFNASIRAIGD